MLKLSAYNSINKYDFICIGETYLDSSVQSGDRDISITGYNLIHADHPSNNKRGRVCINECLLCDVSFNNKQVQLQWNPAI